ARSSRPRTRAPTTRPTPIATNQVRSPYQNESVRLPTSTAATIASTNVIGRSKAAAVHRIRQPYPGPMGETGTTRLETFSDAFFAIAATLLVLEFSVSSADAHDLGSALLHLWPSYLAYATSFITIGIIWMNHHTCVDTLRRADRNMRVI